MVQLRALDAQTNSEILLGFQHAVGRHCGSTSLQDIVNYGGWPLSEAACFGLASGMAHYYKSATAEIPLGIFMGRCRNLENNFFKNCEIDFERTEFKAFTDLEAHIQQKIQAGVPVLLQGDVAGLPYYKSPIHFPGHKFVVCGYNDGKYTIADTAFAELQVVSAQDLDKCTAYSNAMWAGAHTAYDIGTLPELTVDLAAKAVSRAIYQQIRELSASSEVFFLSWHRAHEVWLTSCDFDALIEDKSLAIGARFFYQVIEKRGTGGGAFRGIYLDFVDELMHDRVFPFPILQVLFRSPVGALELLKQLHESVQGSRERLSKIADFYKMLAFRKITRVDARTQIRRQLKNLWYFERGINDLLCLLATEFKPGFQSSQEFMRSKV
jgi:hypothetical protein